VSDPVSDSFPIFPLPNLVLFPGARLPLHIFEPRYRAMARDAISGSGVIGMVLIKPGADATLARAPIFEVGCTGRITEHEELPDGRFALLLEGSRRFQIASEQSGEKPYRVVRAELLHDPRFSELRDSDRATLSRARAEIEAKVIELVHGQAKRATQKLEEFMQALDPVELLLRLAFHLDCGPVEKQGLLEAADPIARAALLTQLLDFRAAERRSPEDAHKLN
jgi:Lon protease-like protein